MENEIKQLNIYEKMALITDEIGIVEKNLKVQVTKTSSYNAVSERDILDSVKPIEKKYRVYSYPVNREIVDNDILVKETEYGKTNTLYLRLKTTYRFINLDKVEEFVDIDTYGDGLDTGDKATGKAMTYADKYALMKAYKISTGDDPDKEPSPQEGYAKEEKTASPKQVEMLENYYTGENLNKLLEMNKVDCLENLPMKKASELISSIMKKGSK